jgi:Mce-associated membrane protein
MTAGPRWLALLVLPVLALSACSFGGGGNDGVDAGMLVSARQEATKFFSLDYRHADADVARVLALATGTFKRQYAARRTEVVSGVTSKQLVVSATIPKDGAAVEFFDKTQGQVLIAVDVTTTTGATGATAGTNSVDRYRTRILLTKVGDRWLVSGIDQVG